MIFEIVNLKNEHSSGGPIMNAVQLNFNRECAVECLARIYTSRLTIIVAEMLSFFLAQRHKIYNLYCQFMLFILSLIGCINLFLFISDDIVRYFTIPA